MKSACFLSGILILLAFASCHKDAEQSPLDMGYTFAPLVSGQWIEYQVDSIKIKGMTQDTVRWYIKEVTDTCWLNQTDYKSYRILRFAKTADTLPWIEQPRVWTTSLSLSEATKVEENTCFVKLIFPLENRKSWNGNAYNSMGIQEYTVVSFDEPLQLNHLQFDFTLKVIQLDLSTLISTDYAEEVYARGIGMISSRKVHIENLQSSQYRTGFIAVYTVKSWGKS